jgi:hypothetical protein
MELMTPIEKKIGYSVEAYQNLNNEIMSAQTAMRTNASFEVLMATKSLIKDARTFLTAMPENDLNREGLGRKIGVLENLCKNSQ